MMRMKPLAELKRHAPHIVGVLTDIDDTLTTRGKLTPETYAAMQALQNACIKLMPITGGPASLALHAARLWPVNAAIGESGAVLYYHDGMQLHTQFWDDATTRATQALKREQTQRRLQEILPRIQVASDQSFRLCDLAINYNEDLSDEERLTEAEQAQVLALLHEEGYTVRQSSIHFNAWLGSYDKLPMSLRALIGLWHVDIDKAREQWLYVGDAPNDEAMFEFFPLSVGVANIDRHLSKMRHHPAYLTNSEAGAGFAEVVNTLLTAR
jgi:HAD superfamily hydrolase (TIGR01484 family)